MGWLARFALIVDKASSRICRRGARQRGIERGGKQAL
jgi:hypothetical protein